MKTESLYLAQRMLEFAVSSIRDGMRFKELSRLIEDFVQKRGYQPLRNFCGHVIGRSPHEEPSILNYLEGVLL